MTVSRRNLRKRQKVFTCYRLFSHFFTPDLKNTKNFIPRDRFLVPPHSVKLKVRFALSVQLYLSQKEHFYAKVFIQLDIMVWYSLVVSKSALKTRQKQRKRTGADDLAS